MLLNHQQGFSLIEVMVAMAIISISLLGFFQAQLMALHASEEAYLMSLADLHNQKLAEEFIICESQSLCLQQALNLWKKEIQQSFPKGMGQISKLNLSTYQSQIQWLLSSSKFLSTIHLVFST